MTKIVDVIKALVGSISDEELEKAERIIEVWRAIKTTE